MFQHKTMNRPGDSPVSLNYARLTQDDNRLTPGTTTNAAADKMDEEKSMNASYNMADDEKTMNAAGSMDEEKTMNAAGSMDEEKTMNAATGSMEEEKSMNAATGSMEEEKSMNAAGEKDEEKSMNASYSANMADDEKTMNAAGSSMDEEKSMNAGGDKMDEEKSMNAAGKMDEEKSMNAASDKVEDLNQSKGKPAGKAFGSSGSAIKSAGRAIGLIGANYLAASRIKASIAPVDGKFGKAGVKRIPPRVDTDVAVKVTGIPEGSKGLFFKVNQVDGNNDGTVTVNGQTSVYIKNDQTLKLRGNKQTEPGHASHLCLAGAYNGINVAYSNHFSVAAFPESIESTTVSPHYASGPNYVHMGGIYNLPSKSDSGVDTDLGKTWISESVSVASKSGVFATSTESNTGFMRPSPHFDHNISKFGDSAQGLKAGLNTGNLIASEKTNHQCFYFACDRTGITTNLATAPLIPKSGFKLKRTFSKVGNRTYFHISRSSLAVGNATGASVATASPGSIELI